MGRARASHNVVQQGLLAGLRLRNHSLRLDDGVSRDDEAVPGSAAMLCSIARPGYCTCSNAADSARNGRRARPAEHS